MPPAERRHLILISGAPGAGKTTLATALAPALALPLFSKDRLKEILADTLGGPVGDLGYSRKLGSAAMELMWHLAASAPAAVLEANFRPNSDYERNRLIALDVRIIEVYCDCPPCEVARRFAARAADGVHAAHPLTALPPELLAEYDRPIGVGPVVRVDTTRPVDISALATSVRELMESGATSSARTSG